MADNRKNPEKYGRNWNHTFVNPYSFVSTLSESNKTNRESVKDYFDGQTLHTGVLHCRMITQTPLSIPDAEKKYHKESDPADHYSYPFYRVNNLPVVPGSSIRGMIRSLYETATDSCFVTMRDNEGLTARVSSREAFRAGILERKADNTWVLYPADRYIIAIKNGPYQVKINKDGHRVICYENTVFENGTPVDITTSLKPMKHGNQTVVNTMSIAMQPGNTHKDYLYIGEPIFKKTHESVFHCNRNKPITVSRETMIGLENTVNIYQNSAINKNLGKGGNTGYASFEQCKKNGLIPVWFRQENNRLYLSMAAIGRKAYAHTVNDLAGEKHRPCLSRNNLCPACMLFGMAKEEAYGGKVRFSDASPKEQPDMIKDAVLQELGTPRTGYLPFYSYKGLDYDASGASIAGRKYYWHISKAKDDPSVYIVRETDSGKQKTERNASMELVPAGTEFTFDVYYDKVTDMQLQELKWILTLGDNTESSRYMQKLGHGKPLGLGSVKILISEDCRRTFSVTEGYHIQNSDEEETIEPTWRIPSSVQKQLAIISDFHVMDNEAVRYPYVEMADSLVMDAHTNLYENDLANHQWFTSNKGRTKDSEKPLLLPGITEEKHRLPVYELLDIPSKDSRRTGKGYGKPEKSQAAYKQHDTSLKDCTGKIKFFSKKDRYGYIIAPDGKEYRYVEEDFPGLIINKTRHNEAVRFKIMKREQGGKIKFSAVQIEYI